MKNTLKNRALSVILAVLMLVSAFAVCIPASAATASETLENAFGKVLWSADFDYEAATARGTATRNLLAAPTNGDGKLNLWTGGGASTGINVSAALTGSALQFVGATYPADCTQGHSKPVIQESYSVEGYKDVCKVKCKCCGQIYYTYDKVESEYDEYAPEIYDIFDETMASEGFRGEVNGNMLPQANETAGFYVGNELGVDASYNIWDDNEVLDEGSFALNFDFMLPENGKVNIDPSMDGNQFWSLLTWVTGNADANSDNGYAAILSVGALDTNSDGTFDKHFLTTGFDAAAQSKTLVSADDATDEQKNNQSIKIEDTTYYYMDDASIYDLKVGEWVNISLSFDTCANMMSIYVNGEHILTQYANVASSLPDISASKSLLRSYLRFGDGFSGRFKYAWALRDVELVPDAGFFGNHSGSPAYVMDFGSADCTLKSNISENVFGTHNAHDKYTRFPDSETAQGYTKYKASSVANLAGGISRMMDVVKSTKNRFTGEFVDVLSSDGSKYSIDVTFAIPDRALKANEITALSAKFKDLDKDSRMHQILAHVSYSILRLSKWSDANQVRLLYCNEKGLYNNQLAESGYWYFCDKAGNIYNPITELDKNGRPLKVTSVKAVIDEWSNTYTLYINGELAYMKNGAESKELKPAANMAMKVQTNSGSLLNKATYTGNKAAYAGVYTNAPEYQAWVKSGNAYAMIPHTLTVTTTDAETGDPVETAVTHGGKSTSYRDISYIRFFQASYEYIVEEIKLEKIKDSDVEYVGSQVKLGTEADTTFDLRFVFGVDDLYANGISYHVTAKVDDLVNASEGKETDVDANVYSSIIAGGKKVNAYEYFEGEYFSVFKVEGVEVSDAKTLYTFEITPYVTNANGKKVATGEVYTVQYNGIGQYVGCSVDTLAE